MQLRVSPDDIAGAAARLADDGPALRDLAALQAASRGPTAKALTGHAVLAGALGDFLACQETALFTLSQTADLLARGLSEAANAYRDTEVRAQVLLGSTHG